MQEAAFSCEHFLCNNTCFISLTRSFAHHRTETRTTQTSCVQGLLKYSKATIDVNSSMHDPKSFYHIRKQGKVAFKGFQGNDNYPIKCGNFKRWVQE